MTPEQFEKLAHDLRNQLGTMLLLADRLSRHADPQVRSAAESIVLAAERAADLLQPSAPAKP